MLTLFNFTSGVLHNTSGEILTQELFAIVSKSQNNAHFARFLLLLQELLAVLNYYYLDCACIKALVKHRYI